MTVAGELWAAVAAGAAAWAVSLVAVLEGEAGARGKARRRLREHGPGLEVGGSGAPGEPRYPAGLSSRPARRLLAALFRRWVLPTRGPAFSAVRGLARGTARRPAPAAGAADRCQRRLARAGLKLRAGEFWALQAVSVAIGAALGARMLPPLPGAAAGAVGGWLLPSLYLERRIQARQAMVEAQLPEALVLVAGALRSGYSLLQALDHAARELPLPLAEELAQVVRERRVDIPLEEALAGLVDRTGSRDLELVATAILIQHRVGGNLAEVLENLAETLRERARIQGQVRVLTAQGRMSGWIIGLLPVALALILLQVHPDYFRVLKEHPLGWAVLAVAAAGELLGVLAIRSLLRLEV